MPSLAPRTRTMLTPDWLPTQPRLAAPSPDDPTTRAEAEALLRGLPHRQRVICAYFAALDALPVWLASGEDSTAPQDALALVRQWLAGDDVSAAQLREAAAAAWEAAASSWATASATVWAAAGAAVGSAGGAVASDTARALGLPLADYLPRWWRRCRAVLACRHTGEAVWC